MKKLFVLLSLVVVGLVVANAQGTTGASVQVKTVKKTLVTYFSATGTTRKVAQRVAKAAGADLKEIQPKQVYTDADLNWHNEKSRSSVEMKDKSSRPAMAKKIDVSAYDVVYIGYPIWWGVAPTIVNTFIESAKLTGKKVVLFATSGSSTIDNSKKELKATYPKLNIVDAKLLNSTTDAELTAWTSGIK
jgi:flavodoxin